MISLRTLAVMLPMLAAASAAGADTIVLKTTLNSETEVPAVTAPGKGVATVTIDTTAKTVKWKVDYSDLSGPVTAAHIHGPAMPGANAPPFVTMATGPSPMEASAGVTDAQIADMVAGKTYINLHTAAHGPGEIRGYLLK